MMRRFCNIPAAWLAVALSFGIGGAHGATTPDAGGSFPFAATFTLLATAQAPGQGDIVASSGSTSGLDGYDTAYLYYAEVPPGTSNLIVQIFDADVGAGSSASEQANNLDILNGGANTSIRYRLRNPSGTIVATQTYNNTQASAHNVWTTLYSTASPAAGHWEIEVDGSSAVTSGDDLNAYGLRAHDNKPGTDGTEINIYALSFVNLGTVPNVTGNSKDYVLYPYVTSGCGCFPRDYDADNGSATSTMSFTTRNGNTLASTLFLSPNGGWASSPVAGYSGWTDDLPAPSPAPPSGSLADGYGIWRMNANIDGVGGSGSNYVPFYFGAFNSLPITTVPQFPNSNPVPQSFRIYLPRDGSTMNAPLSPVKPFLRQVIRGHVSGPNPPDTGQTSVFTIEIQVNNPTPHPIAFSSPSRLVSGFVPSGPVTYQGSPSASQGTVTAQPTIGSNNAAIIWNPGTVAAASMAYLRYNVAVTPTSNGQVVVMTGTPTANGTTATFLDETGVAGFANRGVATLGPLCQLSATEGDVPLSVDLVSLRAIPNPDGGVIVQWETIDEIDNIGFLVFEALIDAKGDPIMGDLLSTEMIPADGGAKSQGVYSWLDEREVPPGTQRGYYLADIDIAGKVAHHGPAWIEKGTIMLHVPVWERY